MAFKELQFLDEFISVSTVYTHDNGDRQSIQIRELPGSAFVEGVQALIQDRHTGEDGGWIHR
jgi:hypothetical protein